MFSFISSISHKLFCLFLFSQPSSLFKNNFVLGLSQNVSMVGGDRGDKRFFAVPECISIIPKMFWWVVKKIDRVRRNKLLYNTLLSFVTNLIRYKNLFIRSHSLLSSKRLVFRYPSPIPMNEIKMDVV
jgi:hypothetical protein